MVRMQGKWRVLSVLAAFGLSIGLLATSFGSAGAGPLEQDRPLANTITVSGDGDAGGQPDVAYVNVGVQTQGATAAAATAENNRLMSAVLEALRGLGISGPDVQTSGLSVTPQYSQGRDQTRQDIVGYQATNSVTVTVNDVNRAGELLDAALAAGANRIGGLRFGIRDTTALRQQAIAEAARAARVRADALASSLGVRIVGISSVTEEAVNVPQPRAAAAFAAPAPAPPTPVETGELRVTARVRVAFLFE